MWNSINNHLGFEKWFIYRACVIDLSIWKIITQAVVMRGICNKVIQSYTEMNELCIFSDFWMYSIHMWALVFKGNLLWLRKNIFQCMIIVFSVTLCHTGILNNNWAAYFARPIRKCYQFNGPGAMFIDILLFWFWDGLWEFSWLLSVLEIQRQEKIILQIV